MTMRKHEVLALLDDLPDEFNGDELLFVLTLKNEIERALAECAPETDVPPVGSSNAESPAARRLRVWSRLYNDKEMMARLRNAIRMGKRRDHWIPFRQILEEERRRGGEG
jgi:hypothetical protein